MEWFFGTADVDPDFLLRSTLTFSFRGPEHAKRSIGYRSTIVNPK